MKSLYHSKAIKILSSNLELANRVKILDLATKLNPNFKNPNITGGYIRDILLGILPADCDVVFEGVSKNQPGVLETIFQASDQLDLPRYQNWEFENVKAVGTTGNLYEDTIGFFSNHTDPTTMFLYDQKGNLQYGHPDSLKNIFKKIYEIRFQGLLVWMTDRGERSYFRVLAGIATRGLYMCIKCGLKPTKESEEVFRKYDFLFNKLTSQEKESILNYWNKKTKNLTKRKVLLKKYRIVNIH